MSKKLTNEEKYQYTKIRIFCWYMIVITGFLTVLLSLFSLFGNLSPIYAIICFILELIFSKIREHYYEDKEESIESEKKKNHPSKKR